MSTSEQYIDNKFQIIKEIGEGFTSKVYYTISKETKQEIAIKKFNSFKKFPLLKDIFISEFNSLMSVNNENIVKIIAANGSGALYVNNDKKEDISYIGTEYCDKGMLLDYILKVEKGFSEKMARGLFIQLLSGLNAMHKEGIIHRDLKTENLFLTKGFILKIGDLGFSRFVDIGKGKASTRLGTKGYQSPELLKGENYDGFANDIFACGVILFILITGYLPFSEAREDDRLYSLIAREKYDQFWAEHAIRYTPSNEAKVLITMMIAKENRIKMADIKKSDWLKGSLPTQDEYYEEMNTRWNRILETRAPKTGKQINNSNNNVVMQYRDKSEEEIIDNKLLEIEKKISSFTVSVWRNSILPRNSILVEGEKIIEVFLQLYKFLFQKFEIEINFNEEEFKFFGKGNYFVDDLCKNDENSFEEIEFLLKFYVVKKPSKSVLIEVIGGSNTNELALHLFIKTIESYLTV